MIWSNLLIIISLRLLTPTTGLVTITSKLFSLNVKVSPGQLFPPVAAFDGVSVNSMVECAVFCTRRQQPCIAFNVQYLNTDTSNVQECLLAENKMTAERREVVYNSFKYLEVFSLDSVPNLLTLSNNSVNSTGGITQAQSTNEVKSSLKTSTTTTLTSITKESTTAIPTKSWTTAITPQETSTVSTIKTTATVPTTTGFTTEKTFLTTFPTTKVRITTKTTDYPTTKTTTTIPTTKEFSTTKIPSTTTTIVPITTGIFTTKSIAPTTTGISTAELPSTTKNIALTTIRISSTKTTITSKQTEVTQATSDEPNTVHAATTMMMRNLYETQVNWVVTYLLFSGNKIYAYSDSNFEVQPFVFSWDDIMPVRKPEASTVEAIATYGDNYHMSLLLNDNTIFNFESRWEGGFKNETYDETLFLPECLLTSNVQAVIDSDDSLQSCIYINKDAAGQTVYRGGHAENKLSVAVSEVMTTNPGSPITASLSIGKLYSVQKILLFMGKKYVVLEHSAFGSWTNKGQFYITF
ncbi:uncharacterized protein LOC143239716 [Tachypleus tridentatus]|uniref:uncharacterized protein LOC143239716 n=1 Tax=Tachypleus tridentatus TaxID=6853 RepID=UPI003FD3443C